MATILKAGNVASGAQITSDSTGILEIKTGTGAGTTALTIGTDQSVNFSGTAQRITGDFSNATIANRVMFQTSTVNEITAVAYIPNGTATDTYQVLYSGTDVNNTSGFLIRSAATESQINAFKSGTGSYLPMTFYTGGSERVRIETSGNFQFNSGYGSVATAYGCRAWVNFDGTTNTGGFCTIRGSGNVTSVADNGVGDYTVNFPAMPDANYAVSYTRSFTSVAPTGTRAHYTIAGSQTTTSVRIAANANNNSTTAEDVVDASVAIFR